MTNISVRVFCGLAAAAWLHATSASAEEIKVLSSVGIKTVIDVLGPRFEQATTHTVRTTFDLAGTLRTKIEGGEPFDVAILTAPLIDDLIAKGKIAPASRTEVARVGLGLMIRAGAAKPDVSTAEAFRRTLLAAKSITYVTTGASGVAFLAIVDKMGIAEAIKAKAKPAANGDEVNASILNGSVDYAVLPISEILPVKGAEVGGVFPAAVQTYVVMTAGVNTAARSGAAREFITYLMSAANTAVVREKGMERPAGAPGLRATRFTENPLITLSTSPSIGDNANGPTVIAVPRWVRNPLGRYYMYFAHHSGQFIRLAYADSVRGPWKIHEPGVLNVKDTAFFRPQPDPVDSPPGVYTHIASPEIYIDEARQRLILWTHGMWTEGQRWPDRRQDAAAWVKQHGYAQYTQAAESSDGLNFHVKPAITRQSYLRVVPFDGRFYGMARLGQLLRAPSPLEVFEPGGSPFRDSPYNNRVRHVTMFEENGLMHVVFSAIGDAPESILYTTMPMKGDWDTWRIGPVSTVLTPETRYECPELPNEKSQVGEIDRPARQLRDPVLFRDEGTLYLFYTFCGEQGIAGAEVGFAP